MRCPNCRFYKSKVLKTLPVLGKSKFRRRVCLKCHHTWPTIETIIEEKDAMDKYPQEVLPFKPKGDKK